MFVFTFVFVLREKEDTNNGTDAKVERDDDPMDDDDILK